ncbi:MAG: thioredoxin-like protein [Monoraphidium minutum]|nr:MAG: thioredoxin-like protein [Monoraphidium minutum]
MLARTAPATAPRRAAAPAAAARPRRPRVAAMAAGPSYTYAEGKFDINQAPRLKVGDKVPMDFELLVLDEGASDPRPVKLSEFAAGRKVVMFGLPGAYTSVCSSKHVPQYNERLDKLKEAGVDAVACLSVNDPWVMREWARQMDVPVDRVAMLADGEGSLHCKLGLLQHIPGLGVRAMRYSMLADDGTIKILQVEEPGGKSYKVSGPDNMLKCIVEGGQ